MEESQKSELCNKCGEYLIPNVYHECKVSISDLITASLQNGNISLCDTIKIVKCKDEDEMKKTLVKIMKDEK